MEFIEERIELSLSPAHLSALAAFDASGRSLMGQEAAYRGAGAGTVAGAGAGAGGGGLGSLMLAASGSVVSASLPECPYQPSGYSIALDFTDSPPWRMVERCLHDPAHCWDRLGNPTSC